MESKYKLKGHLSDLVSKYTENLNQLQKASYNETEVRVDFVNPFFQLLGWDILNKGGLPQHLREVTHEATVLVKENGIHRSKKPDYSFRIGTETLFYLETKKPSIDITVDKTPAFQLRRYGWSGNLKISVLSNFTDLYIYDCSVRPIENDEIGVAMIAHYHYTEYVNKFDDIYGLLSKESVLSGEFEQHFTCIQGAYRREPFDEYFLQQIKNWRNNLGQDLVNNNKELDNETLNICVQRILNRIIFLRICEDRSFEHYETLKSISKYDELRQLFDTSDKKYDSGLFEILDEDNLIVSDEVIIEIFCSLYYPNNSYEFGVVDPYIIGQIYELFLEETLELQTDGSIACIEKPEAVDSQGAVNTPKNITDIIIEQTLEPLYNKKDLQEVANYRIADICCGSGNFLLSAFEFITNYYIELLQKNDLENAVKRGDIYRLPGSTNFYLSYAIRRKILTNNIWGIDIDPLAVEVTKFSLLLKALEGASIEEVDAYVHKTNSTILPNLDKNIRNGNSLVDTSFAKFNPTIYGNRNLLSKIRMFDWAQEFNGKKFDAIVGNPPYIRVQNMVHYSPEEYAFYKSGTADYSTAKADLLDKYYLFIERGLSLLNEEGLLGYVVPHKFMNIKSGKELRSWLANNQSVKRIFHFGTFQAFNKRSTYTCILVLSKKRRDNFEIGFVQDWNRFLFEHSISCNLYSSDYISSQPWTFLPQNIIKKLEAISTKCVPLTQLAEIFVGVQTSADKIYIIKADYEDDNFIHFHNKDNRSYKIEKAILRKSVYDAQLTRYEKIVANSYIIYPYKSENGKAVLYSLNEMKTNFPLTFAYLSEFRSELDKRNMPLRTDDNWFAYGRSQSIKRFMNGSHLIWPVLSLDSNYVYDDEMIVFTGGGNGPFYGLELRKNADESIYYIQAILNHWLMELLVKNKASTFRGGYYSHGKQFIATLPIYKIDFSNLDEKKLHDSIVEKIKTIMDLAEQRKNANNTVQKGVLSRSINAIQVDLQRIIDFIYGVESQKAEE